MFIEIVLHLCAVLFIFCYNCYGFVTAGIITKVLFFVKFSGLSASSCRCFSIERGSRKPRFTRLPAVFCAFCQFFVFMKIFLRKYLFNNLINQHVRRVFFRSFGCRLTLRNTFRRKSAPGNDPFRPPSGCSTDPGAVPFKRPPRVKRRYLRSGPD